MPERIRLQLPMGCQQCLPLSVVQLKSKHCQKTPFLYRGCNVCHAEKRTKRSSNILRDRRKIRLGSIYTHAIL